MIDSAPLWLGIFALIGGLIKAKAEYENSINTDKLESSVKKQKQLYDDSLELIDTILETLNKVIYYIDQILEESENVYNKSNITFQSILNTENLVEKNVKIINNMKSIILQEQSSADDLLGSSTTIEQSIKTINKVFRKINIVSINASIESAKVGKAGAGFAVIANDITNMARETEKIVAKIDDQTTANIALTQNNLNHVTTLRNNITKNSNISAEINDELKIVHKQMKFIENSTISISDNVKLLKTTVNTLDSQALDMKTHIV